MGYTPIDSMVRVDFFKKSGKWYETIGMPWIGYAGDLHEEFKNSLKKYFNNEPHMVGMIAICLKPYNKLCFPLMLEVSSIWEEKKPNKKLEF